MAINSFEQGGSDGVANGSVDLPKFVVVDEIVQDGWCLVNEKIDCQSGTAADQHVKFASHPNFLAKLEKEKLKKLMAEHSSRIRLTPIKCHCATLKRFQVLELDGCPINVASCKKCNSLLRFNKTYRSNSNLRHHFHVCKGDENM